LRGKYCEGAELDTDILGDNNCDSSDSFVCNNKADVSAGSAVCSDRSAFAFVLSFKYFVCFS